MRDERRPSVSWRALLSARASRVAVVSTFAMPMAPAEALPVLPVVLRRLPFRPSWSSSSFIVVLFFFFFFPPFPFRFPVPVNACSAAATSVSTNA